MNNEIDNLLSNINSVVNEKDSDSFANKQKIEEVIIDSFFYHWGTLSLNEIYIKSKITKIKKNHLEDAIETCPENINFNDIVVLIYNKFFTKVAYILITNKKLYYRDDREKTRGVIDNIFNITETYFCKNYIKDSYFRINENKNGKEIQHKVTEIYSLTDELKACDNAFGKMLEGLKKLKNNDQNSI